MHILLTGGTGMIGRELGKELVRRGHTLTVVSRKQNSESEIPYPCRVINFDLTREKISAVSLDGVDSVIHLLGEGIADHRWSEEQKQKLVQSRLESSKNLLASLRASQVKHIVSASAVGYYGDRGDEWLDETSSQGSGFLADLCRDWEKPFREQSTYRWAAIRIGIVLAPFGGALGQLIPLFKKHLGAPVGTGHQWMSWIHIRDLVKMFCQAIEDENVRGVLNGVTPSPVTNLEFSKSLASALNVICLPRVPSAVLKVGLGELSAVVLASQRVQSKEANIEYEFPDLATALRNVTLPHVGPEQTFYGEQYFDRPPAEVFEFFGDAENLQRITPPLLQFHISKMSSAKIERGTLIDYKLRIHGIPVKWRTLIETWEPPNQFLDEQLKGPYKKWRHLHQFSKLGEGTLATDLVRFQVPMGIFGHAIAGKFVESDVKKIFSFRRETMAKLLPKQDAHPTSA